MLFKFTFVPDFQKTEERLIGNSLHELSPEDVGDAMKEIFRGVHNDQYNVFVYAEDMVAAVRKLDSWFDDETCILNHPNYSSIVMNMYAECIDVTENQPVLLNALAVVQ